MITHTYLFHGAESFLKSLLILSWSRNSWHFLTLESSLRPLQVPTTCPYPEPVITHSKEKCETLIWQMIVGHRE
jgi:hypothetical protein